MATTVGTESDLNKLMHNMVEVDYDAIEAYQAAIERVPDTADRTKLTEFMEDHRRHTMDLGRLLKERGQPVPTSGDLKAVLTKGKVVIAGLRGHKEVLEAMRSNEDSTNQVYERAVGQAGVPAEMKALFDRGLRDERRHRAWLIERIGTIA